MNQRPKDEHQKAGEVPPSPSEEVIKQQQKAELREVAGRHKNDAPKDHKGAG